MVWMRIIVRTFLGLIFVVFGAEHFLHFMSMPMPELPERAMQFGGLLKESGYMNLVKALEILGGLLLISGVFAPLGLVILIPIIINIASFEYFLVGKPGIGFAMLALAVVLIGMYWPRFKSLVV